MIENDFLKLTNIKPLYKDRFGRIFWLCPIDLTTHFKYWRRNKSSMRAKVLKIKSTDIIISSRGYDGDYNFSTEVALKKMPLELANIADCFTFDGLKCAIYGDNVVDARKNMIFTPPDYFVAKMTFYKSLERPVEIDNQPITYRGKQIDSGLGK